MGVEGHRSSRGAGPHSGQSTATLSEIVSVVIRDGAKKCDSMDYGCSEELKVEGSSEGGAEAPQGGRKIADGNCKAQDEAKNTQKELSGRGFVEQGRGSCWM